MSEKRFGKRLLTWVLVLVMMLSLLPVSALANWGEQGGHGGGGQGGTGDNPSDGQSTSNVSVNITHGTNGSDRTTYEVFYSVNGGELQTFGDSYAENATAPYSIVFFVAPKQGYAISRITHGGTDGNFLSIVDNNDVTQCAYYQYASTDGNGAVSNGTVDAVKLQQAIKKAKEEKGCVAAFQYSRTAGGSIEVTLNFYTEKLATLEKSVYQINDQTYNESAPQKVKAGDVITYALTVTYHSSAVMPVTYTSVVVTDDKAVEPNSTITFTPDGSKAQTAYVTYTVQASDITGEELTNTATLTYNYTATFNSSTGSSNDTASASVATGSEVSYEYQGEIPAGAEAVPARKTYYEGAEVAVERAPAEVTGYTFSGWTTTTDGVVVAGDKFTMPDGPVKFVGTWTKDATTYYTVTYTDGVEGAAFANQSYTVKAGEATPAFNGTPSREGYDFLGWTPTVAETVTGDATYTAQWKPQEKELYGYTIHHYLLDTEVKVAEDTTGEMEIGETLNAVQAATLSEGFEKAKPTTESLTASKVVTNDPDQNVLTVYYTVPLIITAGSDSKVYNGTRLTCNEFTVEGLVNGDKKENIKLAMTESSVIAIVGEKDNVIDTTKVGGIKPYYTVEYKTGLLKITPVTDEVTVTITGKTDTVTYNGSEQSVEGYTVEIRNPLYTTANFEFKGNAKAKGTDANTYMMDLTASQFKNTSTNFTNVKFEVTDGKLTIGKRSVTLTSETDSKVYDGTSLTNPGVTVTGSFVDGEVSDIRATGTITDVGSVDNTIEYTKSEKFKPGNYDIVENKGTLTITAAPAKEFKLTIEYVYADGSTAATSHTASIIEGGTYSVNSPVISGYTADKTVVSGTMPSQNVSVKVTYTRNYTPVYPPYYPPVTPPTVEIEDDDALGLNTTDHFAYIVGYGNGQVRPQNAITRAEVATIFFRLLTDDVREENFTSTNKYTDVAAGAWYNNAVSTLSAMGIITGYPDGTFRPNAYITRAEFAAIAARFDADGDKTLAAFSDIANHWAKDEISVAYNNGWVDGYPDGTFGPQRNITRAETVTLVNRVLNRKPETEDDLLPDMTTWTDNADKKAWYYLAIQEATNSHYYEYKENSEYEKWTELRETRDWTQLEK